MKKFALALVAAFALCSFASATQKVAVVTKTKTVAVQNVAVQNVAVQKTVVKQKVKVKKRRR